MQINSSAHVSNILTTMNFCNFAKVIIGHNSKVPSSINWWSSKETSTSGTQSTNYSASFRVNFYHNVMQKYPKMALPHDKFVRQLPRLQNYLVNPKYWKNNNKNEEKKTFLGKLVIKKLGITFSKRQSITFHS